MDLEAVQLLNLSPIPELSELELSTMLEQLSGLSDLNGDVTDRNVEDILKEAEDLIDMSSSSRQNEAEPKNLKQNTYFCEELVNQKDVTDNKLEDLVESNRSSPLKTNNETKHYSSPIEQATNTNYSPRCSINVIKSTIDSLKEFSNIMEKQASSKVQHSPTKSNSKVQHSPTKSNRESIKTKEECKVKFDDGQSESLKSLSQFPTTVEPSNTQKKKTKPVIVDRSTRLLNCFERLYQDRPVRLSGKPKIIDKLPKTSAKKKLFKTTASLKDKKQIKPLVSNTKVEESQEKEMLALNKTPQKTFIIDNWLKEENKDVIKKTPSKIVDYCLKEESKVENKPPSKHHIVDNWLKEENKVENKLPSKNHIVDNWLKEDNKVENKSPSKNHIVDNWLKEENTDLVGLSNQPKCSHIFSEDSDSEIVLKYLTQNQNSSVSGFQTDDSSKSVHTKIKGNLIQELLHQMEEIKVQMKKAGVLAECKEKSKEESLAVIDDLRAEVELVRQEVACKSDQSSAIQRLEEQFSSLKDKYNQQVEKLEAENLKLREALNNHQRNHASQVFGHNEILNCEFNTNKLSIPITPSSSIPEREIIRRPSSETCRPPKNSPNSSSNSSPENKVDSGFQSTSTLKEAFSQTEKEQRNISVQCVEEVEEEKETSRSRKPEEEKEQGVKTEFVFGARRTENKENLKKKSGRSTKPFSDFNVQQMTRQKKIISEHETRLLATLRGLQAELSVKDKETRKMKTEMDLLRIQIKRLTKNNKVEGVKKCHIGTQTIGLGPVVQKPYNPQIYEAPNEYEKENEELKLKITTLEESLEVLKEKRINDLQSLHQIHEEEMAKLVSKLQTQSALTKHLHSLLVHR